MKPEIADDPRCRKFSDTIDSACREYIISLGRDGAIDADFSEFLAVALFKGLACSTAEVFADLLVAGRDDAVNTQNFQMHKLLDDVLKHYIAEVIMRRALRGETRN